MKLIIFLAVVVAVAGVGYWFVTNNEGVVDDFLEGLSQESTTTASSSDGDGASGSGATTRSTTAPAATAAPSSSRDVRFVFDGSQSAGVSSSAVAHRSRDSTQQVVGHLLSRTGGGFTGIGRIGKIRGQLYAHVTYPLLSCSILRILVNPPASACLPRASAGLSLRLWASRSARTACG